MKVVITGIRSSLARRVAVLLRDKGYKVMGFARKKGESIEGVEILQGDIRCRESVFDLLNGADGVIHCAALSSPFVPNIGISTLSSYSVILLSKTKLGSTSK